jgi:hypothetical protein
MGWNAEISSKMAVLDPKNKTVVNLHLENMRPFEIFEKKINDIIFIDFSSKIQNFSLFGSKLTELWKIHVWRPS